MRDRGGLLLGLAVFAGLFVMACARVSWADRTYNGAPVTAQGQPATDGGIGAGPRPKPAPPRPQQRVTPSPTPLPPSDDDVGTPSDPTLESPTVEPDEEMSSETYPRAGDSHRESPQASPDDDEQAPPERVPARPHRRTSTETCNHSVDTSSPSAPLSLPWWLPVVLPIPMPQVSYPSYPVSYPPTVGYPVPRNASYPSTSPWTTRTRRSSSYVTPWSGPSGRTWSSPARRPSTHVYWRRR